tara:strand:- start:5442 stop:5693 length:252 start_codon:yes stop_codon:yes gene_type:complete
MKSYHFEINLRRIGEGNIDINVRDAMRGGIILNEFHPELRDAVLSMLVALQDHEDELDFQEEISAFRKKESQRAPKKTKRRTA